MTVQLIRYARANAVPRVAMVIEYESGKFFNIINALKVNTPQSEVAGDGFLVDGEKEKELVKALDKHPALYRAGGESGGSAGASID